MEAIIIFFIIFAVIIPVIVSAGKTKNKSSGAPPVSRPYFPTLSFDEPQPQNHYAPAMDFTEQPQYGKTTEGISFNESVPDVIKPAEADLSALQYDLQELNASVKPDLKEADIPIIEMPGESADSALKRLTLFSDKDDIIKAVIYSEIMRPRFRLR